MSGLWVCGKVNRNRDLRKAKDDAMAGDRILVRCVRCVEWFAVDGCETTRFVRRKKGTKTLKP